MPVPKKKTSRARRDKRRAQHKLHVETASYCPQCRSPKLPHRACPTCGTYKGREVVPVDVDIDTPAPSTD
jgi:large subunit ribosomal protein L32